MKKINVIVDLPGGLGNQLFSYFFSRYCQRFLNANVRYWLNTQYLDKFHSNGKSTLEDFKLPEDVNFFNFGYLLNRIFEPFKRHLHLLNHLPFLRILVLDDSKLEIDAEFIGELLQSRRIKFIFIFGFWQNLNFLTGSELPKLKKSSPQYLKLREEMRNKLPIVFHYRLGKKNGKWEHGWGALDSKYLSKALIAMSSEISSLQHKEIWVFSNDLQEARIQLQNNTNLRFLDDTGLSPAELLSLLTQSRFLICSNSTFSVLAAKIGEVGTVVVPDRMSKNSMHSIEGISNSWILVSSSWLD